MKSRIARVGLIAAEILGVMVAVLLACAAFLAWRVQSGPVDLGWAAPVVRSAANAAFPDGSIRRIGDVSLARAEATGGYQLILRDVMLGERDAPASAEVPLIDVVFFPNDLLTGRVGPRRLLIDGAQLRIVRRSDRRLKLDLGGTTNGRVSVFKSITGGAYFRKAFERAELRNLTMSFYDEATGRTWNGQRGFAAIERSPGGYVATAQSEFDIGGKPSSLALRSNYDLSTDVISSELRVDAAPVGDLVAVFFGADAEPLTSPISGVASIDLTASGAVLSSRVDLVAGAGMLSLGGWSTPLKTFAAAADFDPARNAFTVERIEWDGAAGAGAISGVVALKTGADPIGLERVDFDLKSDATTLVLPATLAAPLAISGAAVKGAYDLKALRLDVADLVADFLSARLAGSLTLQRVENAAPTVKADLTLDGALSPASLLSAWPKNLAFSAREFVATRVPRGAFSAVAATVDLDLRDINEHGALPDDSLSIAFRADDAEVVFAPGMTPLTNVAGKGLLRGNSFRFDAERAEVGKVRLAEGEVEIPVLAPKGELAFFRFAANGDAGDMLRVLDEEPLSILKESQFAADQFAGPASAVVEIARPNLKIAPPEAYQYKGEAEFTGLSVENIIGEATLTGAAGALSLTTKGMTIKGDARLGDAPVRIDWRQRFFGAGDKTEINVTGVANSATADLFGIPTRQIFQGAAPFEAKAVGGVDALRRVDIKADFTEATLASAPLGWMKDAGEKADGSATILFSREGNEISGFSFAGDGFAIRGYAAFTPEGAVRSFAIPEFRLDEAAELSITGERSADGALHVAIDGPRLNAGEMMRLLIEEGAGEGGGKAAMSLRARIDRVDMRGGAAYRDALLDFSRNPDQIETLHFSATGSGGAPLSIDLNQAPGGAAAIEATSDDVGSMLAAIFGLSSVKGGAGRLDFSFTPGADDGPRSGALEAHDLRVVKAPLLAKIFAAGSLTGLSDLVNGEGIELKNATARFSFAENELRIHESRATGPSVGITAQGVFALGGERAIALKGAVAPAYGVNSLLGKAPIIGDLFVNRKGEGLLALSYDVAGPAAEPRVTVNPLSAFTPGVFRRMFEGAAETDEAEAPRADEPK